LITGLLNSRYAPGRMTYDVRRLRLAGLIRRIEHTNRYALTPDDIKFAVLYIKRRNRLLRPSWPLTRISRSWQHPGPMLLANEGRWVRSQDGRSIPV
jgi:hypothetical protein